MRGILAGALLLVGLEVLVSTGGSANYGGAIGWLTSAATSFLSTTSPAIPNIAHYGEAPTVATTASTSSPPPEQAVLT